MKIEKEHREALIIRLEENILKIEKQRRRLHETAEKHKHLLPLVDVDLFLLQKEREVLTRALIDSELDNF